MARAPAGFALAREEMSLPHGATSPGARALLTRAGKPILAFTQGPFRPYLHPVLTPAGHCVSGERPADHPHHAGLWIAAERVAWTPAGGPGEVHTYNFYVDEVFQGRAPGRIEEIAIDLVDDAGVARIVQTIEWRGPAEWGAPAGRLVLAERRTTRVACSEERHVIDVESELSAPTGSVTIGPTRHAYFNARVAARMSLAGEGRVIDSRGLGGDAVSGEGADWVCYVGPVGGGDQASLTVLAAPGSGGGWFASDWGVVTVGPFRRAPGALARGASRSLRYRLIVRDGEAGGVEGDADRLAYLGALGAP